MLEQDFTFGNLQKLLLNESYDLTQALRIALVLSNKNGLGKNAEWIWNELNGYESQNIPDYRICVSTLYEIKPWGHLSQVTLALNSKSIDELISLRTIYVRRPISTVIESKANGMRVLLPREILLSLIEAEAIIPVPRYDVCFYVSQHFIIELIENVRTRLLNFVSSFNNQPTSNHEVNNMTKENQKPQVININNFQGMLGDFSGSTIHQNNTQEIRANDFESLSKRLKELGLERSEIDELHSAIAIDGKPNESGKIGNEVSSWMDKMIAKSASGAWKIAVSTASVVLAEAIKNYYVM